MGVGGATSRTHVLLHKQLAPGTAGGQSSDAGCRRMERTVTGCFAGRNRVAAGRLWPLEFSRMARTRTKSHIVPPPGRSGFNAGAAVLRMVLFGNGASVSLA